MINLTKTIAAVLVLLALALGAYAWMLSRKGPPATAPTPPTALSGNADRTQTFPVVIATKPLPAGQAIPADALRIENLTINPSGAFKETAPLEGRVPVIDLGEGSPLLEGQLVSGLALRVAEGERAFAIKADEIMGVGNQVQPGDFVDVFLMLKADGREKDIDRSQARLLLSRKRVLAYGSASVDGLPSKTDKNAAAQQAQRAESARTVVLAVAVDDINRLTLAENSGRLLLALRNPTDMSQPDPKLFAELPTALQPAPPKAGEPRRPPLEGLDRAQAGTTAADFVTGGQPTALRVPAIAATRAPVSSNGNSGARRGLQVEVIRGDRSETINY